MSSFKSTPIKNSIEFHYEKFPTKVSINLQLENLNFLSRPEIEK
jgi:hypothetical protein